MELQHDPFRIKILPNRFDKTHHVLYIVIIYRKSVDQKFSIVCSNDRKNKEISPPIRVQKIDSNKRKKTQSSYSMRYRPSRSYEITISFTHVPITHSHYKINETIFPKMLHK